HLTNRILFGILYLRDTTSQAEPGAIKKRQWRGQRWLALACGDDRLPDIHLHKEAAMIITLNQATLPQLFVHYRFTDPSRRPCPMCCTMRDRDEDRPEPSK